MAVRTAEQPQQPTGRILLPAGRGRLPRLSRADLLPWLAVVAAGAILGLAVVAATGLSNSWAPLLLVAVICPFVMAIVGGARPFLLAAIALDIPLQLDLNLGYHSSAAALGALGGLSI